VNLASASALGAAMFGAAVAGRAAGGYDSIPEAAQCMARLQKESYQPIRAHQAAYDQLYAEYARLYDHFGRGENNVMKTLKRIKAEARSGMFLTDNDRPAVHAADLGAGAGLVDDEQKLVRPR